MRRVIAELECHEPLPFRLSERIRPGYLEKRRAIEGVMHEAFVARGGRPETTCPYYFVVGRFPTWEEDGSLKVELPVACVPDEMVSFTLTDSFFNYRRENLRGIPIPARPYHGELLRLAELPAALEAYGLPAEHRPRDPRRMFDVYIEAQIWSDVARKAA